MKKFTFLFVFALLANLIIGSAAFGQISLVGTPQTATATGGATTLTIPKPTGLAAGHVMIAHIVQANNTDNGLSDASRAGWTEITGSSNNDNANRFRGTLLYRIADAADAAAVSFAFSLDADENDAEGYIVAFSGVTTTSGFDAGGNANSGLFDVDPGTWNNLTSNSLVANPSTTATVSAAVIMFSGLADNSNIGSWSTTTPGALTELYDTPLDGPGGPMDLGIGAAWVIKPTTGSTGNGTATTTATPRSQSVLIALRPISPASVTINPPALSISTILVGGNLNLTATRNWDPSWTGGNGNFTYTWSSTGPAALAFTSNPNTITGTSSATNATGFSVAGEYTIICTVQEQGGGLTKVSLSKKLMYWQQRQQLLIYGQLHQMVPGYRIL
ncbi:MAG: hypothetical protein IPO53_00855 [Chitinophagaceae bacterium]|nr:hypothetical protein [Chitinophagaceae bacterium]